MGDSFLESPDDSPAAVDEVSIDAAGWSDDSDASRGQREQAFSMSSPAEEPPSAADAEASFDVDTQDSGNPELDGYRDDQEIAPTERQGWLLRHADRDLPRENGGETDSAAEQGEDRASFDDPGSYESGAAGEQGSHEQDNPDEQPRGNEEEESIP